MHKTLMGLALAGALIAPAVAHAAPSVDKVTGGGQIVADGVRGAGDTIAFTAQGTDAANGGAKGQVQYNERSTGFKVHGVVDCVTVVGDDRGMAVLGGTYRDDPGERFRVYVADNGQGSAAENDMIMFEQVDEEQDAEDGRGICEAEDDSFEDLPTLGRGNAKIHKENPGASRSGGPGETSDQAVRLGALAI